MLRDVLDSREKILVLWGAFDVIHVLFLSYVTIKAGKVPYFSDISSMLEVLSSLGAGPAMYALAIGGALMEASILLSAGVLLMRRPIAVPICWIQLPFRLLYSLPSISVIPMLLGFFENYSLLVAFGMIVSSELIKAYTLWRVSRR